MENTNEINRIIAKNLTYYRKAAGLTQAELAEKINYSDKSVSKWESGNGIPDVYTLMQLAELYGVTLNAFVGKEEPKPEPPISEQKPKNRGLHILIMLLSSGIVWLVATCLFVALQIFDPSLPAWISFVYAVAINAIILVVYASIWKYRLLNFFSVSILVWMTLTSVYLTGRLIAVYNGASFDGLWCLFLLGVPLQILEILWVFFRSLFRKNREKANGGSGKQAKAERNKAEQTEKLVEEKAETQSEITTTEG